LGLWWRAFESIECVCSGGNGYQNYSVWDVKPCILIHMYHYFAKKKKTLPPFSRWILYQTTLCHA
jgi:hypothetical protein